MSQRTLAVCSWSMRPADAGQLVERVTQSGVTAVQLALVPLVDAPKVWGESVTRLRDAGIRIESGMFAPRGEDYSSIPRIRDTGGLRADALWQENQALAAKVARVARDIGLSLVTFHAGFIPHDAGDPLRGFRLLKPWVRQVHAKDAQPSGQMDVWGRETPVGAGAVPWTAFMQEVRSLPPSVAVVIEREGGERRVQEVASAKAFLQPML